MIKLGGIVNIQGMWLNESEDAKYTHIGYGRFKLKGKEDDENTPVFIRKQNKYIPLKKADDSETDKGKAEPEKPKVNIFDKPNDTKSKAATTKEPEKPNVNIFDKPKQKVSEPQVGDKVTITTPSLGKQYVGMHGEINPRKLGNGKYSVKLDNGMDMAFSADEFKHNSINPRWGNTDAKPKQKVSPKFKDLEKFVHMASTAKDGLDFINQARKDTNVPRETSQKFNNMYGHLPMNKAADQFVEDVKNGDFYENDRDRAEKTYKPKFKKGNVVYNKNTNTVGIVRMSDDTYGEVKTDADGNVDIDVLEPYNPKIHKNAKIAPSTKKEIETRQSTKGKSKEVPSTKLQTLMPKSNPKTFSGKSDIGKISPKQKQEISMKIDELDRVAKEARAKGEQSPNFNLCQITVPGTNLYCDNNLGVPREEMPQFKGKPQPNTPAAKMKVDANGEVDTEPLFKRMLVKKGIKTYATEIPSDALKATQSELVGAKVAGMTKALEENPNNPGITAPIYVSRDGYVIDGHHRWAAVTSMAISQGKPTNMKVIVIDDDARNIIPMANKFAEEIGVAAKKADANQEGPTKEHKSTTSLMKMIRESIVK